MWRWYLVTVVCGFLMGQGPEWLVTDAAELVRSAQGDLLLAGLYACAAAGVLAFGLPGLYLVIRSRTRHRAGIPEPQGPPPWFMWPAVAGALVSMALVQLFNLGVVR